MNNLWILKVEIKKGTNAVWKKILSLVNVDTIVCPGHGTQGEKIKYKS